MITVLLYQRILVKKIQKQSNEQILRLIVLSDTKNYNDKTLRLGVITLDLESALYSRLNRKEQPNELCNI